MTVPGAASGTAREATASWRAGSNIAPMSSRREKPSLASTSTACCWMCSMPSMIEPGSTSACASARSRLSSTGSHWLATWARASAAARRTWSAHRLRALSASARARSRRSLASASWASRSAGAASPPLPGAARPSTGSLIGGELGVDHVVAAIALRGPGRPALRARGRAEPVIDLLQLAGELAEPGQGRVLFEGLPGVGHQVLRAGLLVHGDRVAAVGQQPLHLVGGGVEGVAGVGKLAHPQVLVAVPLCVRDHALDLGLVQVGALADRDPLLGAGILVPGRYVQD